MPFKMCIGAGNLYIGFYTVCEYIKCDGRITLFT